MKRKFEFRCEFAWLASSEINQLGFNWTFELEFKERSQSKADIISAEWKAWIYNINSSFISSVFSTCFPPKCLRICGIICDVHLPNVTQRRVCYWKSCTFVIHLLNLCCKWRHLCSGATWAFCCDSSVTVDNTVLSRRNHPSAMFSYYFSSLVMELFWNFRFPHSRNIRAVRELPVLTFPKLPLKLLNL